MMSNGAGEGLIGPVVENHDGRPDCGSAASTEAGSRRSDPAVLVAEHECCRVTVEVDEEATVVLTTSCALREETSEVILDRAAARLLADHLTAIVGGPQ